MAQFSDHFQSTSTATSMVTSVEVGKKPGINQIHVLEHVVATIVVPTTAQGSVVTADVTRMFSLGRYDKLWGLTLSGPATFASTASLINIGLYEQGTNHDGAVVDMDLFTSLYDSSSGIGTRVEALTEAGTLTNDLRGAAAWEMADVTGTYTADSTADFDVCITWGTVTAITVGGTVFLEAEVQRSGGT